MEAAAKRMESVRQRLKEIEASNQLGGETSRLYGLVMDLADTHSVQIQSLQPVAGKPAKDDLVTMSKIELVVEGSYENVAAFIEAVHRLNAFIRPLSLQLTPRTIDGQPGVTAALGCGVLSFALADALAQPGGAEHGKP
jgi:Tfp pilus assembly protein PilO